MNATLRETISNSLERHQAAYDAALEAGAEDTEQHRKAIAGDKANLATLDTDAAARWSPGPFVSTEKARQC